MQAGRHTTPLTVIDTGPAPSSTSAHACCCCITAGGLSSWPAVASQLARPQPARTIDRPSPPRAIAPIRQGAVEPERVAMRSKRVDARTPTPPKRVQLFSRGRYLSEKEQKYLISRGQRPDRRLRHPWAAPPTLAWRSMHRLRPAAPRLSLERARVTRGGRRRAASARISCSCCQCSAHAASSAHAPSTAPRGAQRTTFTKRRLLGAGRAESRPVDCPQRAPHSSKCPGFGTDQKIGPPWRARVPTTPSFHRIACPTTLVTCPLTPRAPHAGRGGRRCSAARRRFYRSVFLRGWCRTSAPVAQTRARSASRLALAAPPAQHRPTRGEGREYCVQRMQRVQVRRLTSTAKSGQYQRDIRLLYILFF